MCHTHTYIPTHLQMHALPRTLAAFQHCDSGACKDTAEGPAVETEG